MFRKTGSGLTPIDHRDRYVFFNAIPGGGTIVTSERLMGFALHLRDSLRNRESEGLEEIARGDPLRVVLTRYLLAVEAAAETDMLTSILLLENGQLRHGAAPNLPAAYCSAIDGVAIGPDAGSCGTAAHLGHPIYVTDIATDRLWDAYRDIAFEHGLRACWSTPIRDGRGAIIGTFAIYHLTPRSPTRAEVEAIQTITDHVASAITTSNPAADRSPNAGAPSETFLNVVDEDRPRPFRDIANDFEQIVLVIDKAGAALARHGFGSIEVARLRRAKEAAIRGAALARSARPPGRVP
jgi:GAF domain-containing protein